MTTHKTVIDLHSHWFAPSTLDILGRRAEAPRIGRQGDELAIWRTGAGAGKGGAFPLVRNGTICKPD